MTDYTSKKLAVIMRFPAGRYHATPWDRHVNEGVVEWPPSNWRILRALIAVWHRLDRPGGEDAMRSIIDALSTPPSYAVPKTSFGHSRHYMPKYNTPKDNKTDKIFDTFAVIDRDAPLIIAWNLQDNSDIDLEILDTLLSNLSYLGRSESWVTAERTELPDDWAPNVYPADTRGEPGENREFIRCLTPVRETEYREWREKELNGLDPKDRKKKEKLYPATMLDSLQTGTSRLRKEGWNRPPGSRWITCSRPVQKVVIPHTAIRADIDLMPDTARFTVVSAVQPRINDTLHLGERLRQALMAHSRYGNNLGDVSMVFAGKDISGEPLKNQHEHAFFIPEDADGDGFIDHFIVYAAGGFDPPAMRALGSLRKLWGEGGHDLLVVLSALGKRSEIGGKDHYYGYSPVMAESSRWRSVTPFYMTRHPKRYRNGKPKINHQGQWIDGPENQIRRELAQRGFPPPENVILKHTTDRRGKKQYPIEFGSRRKRGPNRPNLPGHFAQIVFNRPVRGPFVLGYGCHFGLGLFMPEDAP